MQENAKGVDDRTSPAQAIDLLGGYRLVASALKRPLTTVASWFTRNSIPVEAWPSLIRLAKSRKIGGFTYEALAQAHAKAKAIKTGASEQAAA
jgi:hypothetical protein